MKCKYKVRSPAEVCVPYLSISCNSSDGGNISAKAGVKLAYKTVFALIFTSDAGFFGQEDKPYELLQNSRSGMTKGTVPCIMTA